MAGLTCSKGALMAGLTPHSPVDKVGDLWAEVQSSNLAIYKHGISLTGAKHLCYE